MEINNSYTFQISDMGTRTLKATYNKNPDIYTSREINILGSNLVSTESEGAHLYLRSSDGKYLNYREER